MKEVWVFNSATVVRLLLRSVLNNQSCQHKAEDGSDVGQGSVDLGFRRAPFMIQETLVTRTIFRFGTHTLLGAAGGVMAFVFQ